MRVAWKKKKKKRSAGEGGLNEEEMVLSSLFLLGFYRAFAVTQTQKTRFWLCQHARTITLDLPGSGVYLAHHAGLKTVRRVFILDLYTHHVPWNGSARIWFFFSYDHTERLIQHDHRIFFLWTRRCWCMEGIRERETAFARSRGTATTTTHYDSHHQH